MSSPDPYLVPFPNVGISITDPAIIGSKLRGQVRFDGIAGANADYRLHSVFPNKNQQKNPSIMKCIELNPEGNFDPWEPSKLLSLIHI